MNFELKEEQRLLVELVREFAQKEIHSKIDEFEHQHAFPKDILRKLAELGLFGMTVPTEYGGTRTDYLSFVLALEELSRTSPAVCLIVSVHSALFCGLLMAYGTPKQKEKYLPGAARGEILGAFALTEPNAGSDTSRLAAKAVESGDEYILNGTKTWVTSGSEADALILVAQTEIEPGIWKPSAFIVDGASPGFKVTKTEDKMGLYSSPTAAIVFEDCRVPMENLLGEKGRGISIALRGLDSSRISIAAQAVGLSQRALDLAVPYAKQREAFGKPIAELQAIQFMVADMGTTIDAGRFLTYRAADRLDRGQTYSKEAAMAKLFATEAANKVAYLALQIHGAYGYSREYEVERIYRDARVMSIYEGTSEIQRLVIARNLLKES
jgi:alkylation response protein AidB-like acyl-CoA dehydrogenase